MTLSTGAKVGIVVSTLIVLGIVLTAGILIKIYFFSSTNQVTNTCTSTSSYSWSAYSSCTNGVQTRKKVYTNCTPEREEVETVNCVCNTTYGPWVPSDATCTYGQQRTRTVTTTGTNCSTPPSVTETKTCTTQNSSTNTIDLI
jgi:hypothetical protein